MRDALGYRLMFLMALTLGCGTRHGPGTSRSSSEPQTRSRDVSGMVAPPAEATLSSTPAPNHAVSLASGESRSLDGELTVDVVAIEAADAGAPMARVELRHRQIAGTLVLHTPVAETTRVKWTGEHRITLWSIEGGSRAVLSVDRVSERIVGRRRVRLEKHKEYALVPERLDVELRRLNGVYDSRPRSLFDQSKPTAWKVRLVFLERDEQLGHGRVTETLEERGEIGDRWTWRDYSLMLAGVDEEARWVEVEVTQFELEPVRAE